MNEDTVKVAVRIRPLLGDEISRGCKNCLAVVPGEPQIQVVDTDKAFTYNYVFPPEVDQNDFYSTAIKGMIGNIFEGSIYINLILYFFFPKNNKNLLIILFVRYFQDIT